MATSRSLAIVGCEVYEFVEHVGGMWGVWVTQVGREGISDKGKNLFRKVSRLEAAAGP